MPVNAAALLCQAGHHEADTAVVEVKVDALEVLIRYPVCGACGAVDDAAKAARWLTRELLRRGWEQEA